MNGNDTDRLGFWSAVLVALWVALFALFILIGLAGASTLSLSFLVCLLLAPSFVVMMTSIHCQAPAGKRIWSRLGASFAVIYAMMVSFNYYIQLAVVRKVTADEARPFLFVPGTALFAVDMLGYGFMCLATWFAAPAFPGTDRLSAWIRRLMILHGVLLFPTLIAPALIPAAPQAAASGAAAPGAQTSDLIGNLVLLFWCAVFIPIPLLVARYFRRRLTAAAAHQAGGASGQAS